jgi:hypothetical protein
MATWGRRGPDGRLAHPGGCRPYKALSPVTIDGVVYPARVGRA